MAEQKRRRGRPPKNKPAGESPAVVTKDPLDNKLDHFQYRASDRDMEIWEHGDANPLKVPREIKERYPNLRFRWTSKSNWDKRGKEYHGWQKFSDSDNPHGVTRGNDLFLSAMPEEKALKYNKYVSEKSHNAIRQLQEKQIESADRAQRAGIEALGDGLVINTNRRRAGYSREELMELVRKNREEHEKNRKYFT